MRFLRRLIHFYKPSSNKFSHQDIGMSKTMPSYVAAGMKLIDWLLSRNEVIFVCLMCRPPNTTPIPPIALISKSIFLVHLQVEATLLLTEYFRDIDTQLQAICTAKSAHDCLFSPQHMASTMCQIYFLYIGRMCRTKMGIKILNDIKVFPQ